MSEQKPEKPANAPSWWVPIVFTVVFTAVFTSLFNNLSTVVIFIGTGVVHLSHTGIGPFLLTLGLSFICGLVGAILGIRLCLYLIFYLIDSIFRHVKLPPVTATPQQLDAIKANVNAKVPESPPPDPPKGWEAVRMRASEIAGAVFAWLIIPKWPSRPR